MVPGLPQGFVRFDTLHHKILLFALEHGSVRQIDVLEELEFEPRHIATALRRLREHGFLFPQGKSHKYDTGDKTQMVYALTPRVSRPKYRKATAAQRQARFRKSKAMRVPSVFAFRASINIQGEHQ